MGLLSSIPNITLIPYDKKNRMERRFITLETTKNKQFDALLNMQTAFRASILSLGIKAKFKIGFGENVLAKGNGYL